jgi:tetratricopeptide (TPR) repeat protein
MTQLFFIFFLLAAWVSPVTASHLDSLEVDSRVLTSSFISYSVNTDNLVNPDGTCKCYLRNGPLTDEIERCVNAYVYETRQLRCMLSVHGRRYPSWRYEYHDIQAALVRKINDLSYIPYKYFSITHQGLLLYDQRVDVSMACALRQNSYDHVPSKWDGEKQKSELAEKKAKEESKIRIDVDKCKKSYAQCLEKVKQIYAKIHKQCMEKHGTAKTYYDAGLIAVTNGNHAEAIEYLRQAMEKAGDIVLDAGCYHSLGVASLELMAYEDALAWLTRAIEEDPSNKDNYFYRALAYFETGDFHRSLEDYIASEKKTCHLLNNMGNTEFCSAFISAITRGALESAEDFVPSLCSTAYGVGSALWTSATQPIDTIGYLANTSYEMGVQLINHLCALDADALADFKNECITELVRLYEQFSDLTSAEKGELIGYAIGRYGVDILASSTAVGTVSSFNKLKEANRICNLESMALSSNKEKMVSLAQRHAAERQKFFEGVKIKTDQQNKHVQGKHNYLEGRSVFENKEPQRLLDQFAGKGKPVNGEIPGSANFKEVVDFKEHIGIWKDKAGNSLPTTKGTIHYSKDGAHIVPAHPDTLV